MFARSSDGMIEIRQGTATNDFIRVLAGNYLTTNLGTGETVGSLPAGPSDFKVCFPEGYPENKSKLSLATRTLDLIMAQMKSSEDVITFNLSEYLALRNCRNRKEARKRLQEGLKIFFHAEMTFTDNTVKLNKKNPRYTLIHLIDEIQSTRQEIVIRLSKPFAQLTSRYPKVSVPPALFQINDNNNRYAYLLGRSIFIHRYMRRKAPEKSRDEIKIAPLLSQCGFPTAESVNGKMLERIVRPFIRDMNLLSSAGLFDWSFVKSHDPEATPSGNYHDFAAATIRITMQTGGVARRELGGGTERNGG